MGYLNTKIGNQRIGGKKEQMGSQILTGIGWGGDGGRGRRNFFCFKEFRIMSGFSSRKISTNLRCRPETQNQ